MSAGSLGSFPEAQTAKPPTVGVRSTGRREKRILAGWVDMLMDGLLLERILSA